MLNNGRISESASIKLKKADPVLNKITWISNPACCFLGLISVILDWNISNLLFRF